jgi:propane monooxygenase small subunit
MQDWLTEYVPMCVEALNQMQPIWSQPQVKRVQFVDAFSRAKNRLTTTLSQINIELPQGVNL